MLGIDLADPMPNYLEYSDLFEYYTVADLRMAWGALHDYNIEITLAESNSPLLIFLSDTHLQEMLMLYMEDKISSEKYREVQDEL